MANPPQVLGEQSLVSGPAPPQADEAPRRPPVAAAAVRLAEQLQGGGLTLFLAASERRADETARALRGLLGSRPVEILVLPPWDSLPYDRAGPSRECMGRRMAVLATLRAPAVAERVLVLSPAALLQKAPAPSELGDHFEIRAGEPLDREALAAFARRAGYVEDDRIDEPGEIAFRGEVIDVFPAAACAPVRIDDGADGLVAGLRPFDPTTQRSDGELSDIRLYAVSEPGCVPGAEADEGDQQPAPAGVSIETLTGPGRWVHEAGALEACERFAERARDAWSAACEFGDGPRPRPPEEVYLAVEAIPTGLSDEAGRLATETAGAVPSFHLTPRRGAAVADFIEQKRTAGRRVVLSGLIHERRAIRRLLGRRLTETPAEAADWGEVIAAPPGSFLMLDADLDAGFDDPQAAVTVLSPSEILGGRLAGRAAAVSAWLEEPELAFGDVVLHEDHGLGLLQALERIEANGREQDVVRIGYQGGAHVLAPVGELAKIWRYGSEPEAVTLDRLHSDGWLRRRAEVSAHIDVAARALAGQAEARAAAQAPTIEPPRVDYARLSARFPYPESADQAAAIQAVLDDLGSGRPMNRLVCGDVGFGKTEVALRAAAAVALCGLQVLVAAPTTVLARQHYESFRRRFAQSGVVVAHLSRLVDDAEAVRVRAGLAAGSIDVVVGTQALAADGLALHAPGLAIIDEEHRFGAQLKAELAAKAPHVLGLTATPIPRTLQGALVGIQDVSVIASPPARRRPIRTFTAEFDGGSVRTALLRERARGGQTFVVTPRIADMAELRARLAELAPELTVMEAHGRMSPDAVDQAMVAFAAGEGDVLLATNIIENGLDVPRANTILIFRPDRFGLSQLHQLRGRVGRGRRQGAAYFLLQPGEDVGDAARARLAVLETFDRLGAGFVLSARDLDLRGGGDLVGDEQAGHVRLIGAGLYQHLLDAAIRTARGEALDDHGPVELPLEGGHIPAAYVPEAAVRLNLYARLSRLRCADDLEEMAAELEDRFGAPPDPVVDLLRYARLSLLARAAGVTRILSGPKGTAFSFAPHRLGEATNRVGESAARRWSEDRLILDASNDPADDDALLEAVLAKLAG